ncbi:alpha/beta-hydrolase family protein [Actinomyces sp. oral taxon 181]|uniref:alpha/beta hydrolase n=1 Tax=Actinomyces sp. oral taxon 181 TaxID=712121 RepID=UPI0025C6E196|nr:alpha/beta-hydrolase family protein [Actinomyces sp. oral taxon 181]MBS5750429.1 alpha/beta-hydrolase family protein [Actinomyces sp. oral taxon 181]
MDISLIGVVGALVMYGVSVSPSLLARSWQWHAVASGVLSAVGYIVGLTIQRFYALVVPRLGVEITAPQSVSIAFRAVLLLGFFLWFLRWLLQSYRERKRANHLVGMRGETLGEYLLGTFCAFILMLALLGIAWGLQWIGRAIVIVLSRWMPMVFALALSLLILVVIVYALTSQVLLKLGINFFTRHARKMNNRTAKGIVQPQVPERSGSPQSYSSWRAVGGQGRVFLGRGPSRADIEAVTGCSAMEPIRVYAGMPEEGQSLQSAADLVVEELHRTGAFDRSVILIATSTGSGWVDEWQVQPVEYLTRGNCATASMQYSFVPSSINFLTDLDVSEEAAVILFETIRRAVDEIPEDRRPALFVCGESLGAYASQHVFSGIVDVLSRTDGALWVGTPAFTPMHAELTAIRHRGSPEVAPVVANGRHVRFVNVPENLWSDVYGRELGDWNYPRVVYAQHPSDPVVWWNSELVWHKPDWISEKVDGDVSLRMQYTRGATYIQVLVDMPVAGTAPGGHGHTYHEELTPLWEAILGLREDERNAGSHFGLDSRWIQEDTHEKIGRAIRENLSRSERQ